MFLTKCLWKCPNPTSPPLAWKNSGCAPASLYWDTFYIYYICVNAGPCLDLGLFMLYLCDVFFIFIFIFIIINRIISSIQTYLSFCLFVWNNRNNSASAPCFSASVMALEFKSLSEKNGLILFQSFLSDREIFLCLNCWNIIFWFS